VESGLHEHGLDLMLGRPAGTSLADAVSFVFIRDQRIQEVDELDPLLLRSREPRCVMASKLNLGRTKTAIAERHATPLRIQTRPSDSHAVGCLPELCGSRNCPVCR
jgi:hypothetical protein